MKAVLIEQEVEAKELTYPVLAKSKQFGYVVYFISTCEGVVVVSSNKRKAGYRDTCWKHVGCEEVWHILPPTAKVELSNE